MNQKKNYRIFKIEFIHRVVALDLRGQNQSDKPNGTENYKLETIISDLKAFIECLGN